MPGNPPTPRPPAGSAHAPANRPRSIRPAAGLVVVLLLVALVPAVSAFEPVDKSIDILNYGESHFTDLPQNQGATGGRTFNQLLFPNIEYCNQIRLIQFEHSGSYWSVPEQSQNTHVTYTIGSTVIGYGEAGTFRAGANKVVWFTFDSWDISGYSGNQVVTVTPDTPITFPGTNAYTFYRIGETNYNWDDNAHRVYLKTPAAEGILTAHCSMYYTEEFRNRFMINDVNGVYEFSLYRNIGGKAYGSNLYLQSGDTIYSTGVVNSLLDEEYKLLSDNIQVGIRPLGAAQWHNYTYGESGPGEEPISDNRVVSVYVQNSQTGALLANAHIIISAAAGDPVELHEVINETLPGGTKTYTLQPTGPANPNPRYYRLTADVPGYNNVMPYIDFELSAGVPLSLHVMMEPTGAPPVNENNTFIEVYVRDTHANPISGASVTLDRYTLQTNSAGYTQFELPKNAAYAYTVRKTGYMTISGTAAVEDAPRYTVNVVLGPGTVPTYTPTVAPGETPGATPTPDTRTNEQKGQAVIDLLADFAFPIAVLAVLATIYGLLGMMMPRRR